jgi:hypothetical protein
LCFLGVEQRARRLGEWAGLTDSVRVKIMGLIIIAAG